MFNFIKRKTLYIRLYTNSVLIRDVESKKEIKREAIKPFSNGRLLFADYEQGEELLIQTIKELFAGEPVFSFNIILQPMEKIEGGLSSVEKRAFIDSMQHIGGKNIIIYDETNHLNDGMVLEMVKKS